MEKRYQVFISSTFQDLQNARQEVSQALLRANCFPAGMELFPAADAEQFEYIKTIIDQSDYYILISAGRYGSIHPESGLSYTEMEYDYAVQTQKPIIRLLHQDPFSKLAGEFIEQNDRGRESLRKFRDKLSATSLVKYWSNPSELKAEAVFALQDIQARKPALGWVRSDRMSAEDAELQIAKLHQKIAELELSNARLPQGNIDVVEVFSDIEGDTCINILSKSLPSVGTIGVEVADGQSTAIIPTKDLCWAMATAMASNFIDSEIACDAIRLLWVRESHTWLNDLIILDDNQLGFIRAFAFLRERHVATPSPVAGFTERQTVNSENPISSMLARWSTNAPTFSKRITWSLNEAAAVSACSWFVKIASYGDR